MSRYVISAAKRSFGELEDDDEELFPSKKVWDWKPYPLKIPGTPSLVEKMLHHFLFLDVWSHPYWRCRSCNNHHNKFEGKVPSTHVENDSLFRKFVFSYF